jgi:predicted TIM-barrel fold metal-dependent hydrolase
MAYSKDSRSAKVRGQLTHPVIDGDGHWLEPIPIFLDYLRSVAGSGLTGAVEKFMKKATDTTWYDIGPAERRERRLMRPTWWGEPAHTLDRATAMIPRLFYERLDDFGIDYALVYTSLGLFFVSNPDEELRRAVARAVNHMNAEMFAPFQDRMTPAAVVPVHTPEEAIEVATYAVGQLGLKVIMIANHVRRPVPAAAAVVADAMTHGRLYIDSLGLESPHDYDPFWQACLDLKVAVTAHSGSMGWHGRESVDSFTFNHIGHFAHASHTFARALILGGVTHRFPGLRFAFLEGGAAWACTLLSDLVGHWEKRRGDALEAQTRPTNIDRATLARLFREFGGRVFEEKTDEILRCINLAEPFKTPEELTERAYQQPAFDDFGGRAPAALRGALLLRVRGRRSHDGLGVRPARPPSPAAHLQLGRRTLRRGGHDRGARGGLRAGRARPDHRGRPARVPVHQPGAAAHRGESRLLQGHGGGGRGGQGAGALLSFHPVRAPRTLRALTY